MRRTKGGGSRTGTAPYLRFAVTLLDPAVLTDRPAPGRSTNSPGSTSVWDGPPRPPDAADAMEARWCGRNP
ncbi:hypothetical protein ACFV2D_16975 [Streptomyces capillispiralis]|uniref:hypothetical protein n=1 Tax=Streptomyces capillispiralis TaxID=68182 RepID=UPI0036B0481F